MRIIIVYHVQMYDCNAAYGINNRKQCSEMPCRKCALIMLNKFSVFLILIRSNHVVAHINAVIEFQPENGIIILSNIE